MLVTNLSLWNKVVLALRAWAIWDRKRIVAIGLTVWTAAMWIPNFAIMGIFLNTLKCEPESFSLPSVKMFMMLFYYKIQSSHCQRLGWRVVSFQEVAQFLASTGFYWWCTRPVSNLRSPCLIFIDLQSLQGLYSCLLWKRWDSVRFRSTTSNGFRHWWQLFHNRSDARQLWTLQGSLPRR